MGVQAVYTSEQMKEISEMIASAAKHTPASTALVGPTLHGPYHESATQYGLFTYPGVRPERFSALARPDSLVGVLGVSRSEYTEEILEIMTGVTTASGTNAAGFCGDPPAVGAAKVCQQIYKFGKYIIKTDLQAIPELGQLRNRADIPAQILNAGPTQNPLIPDIFYKLADPRSQLQYELWRIGVEFERTLDVVAFQGNISTAYTATQHGWTVEFDGLDRQVKTGYTDRVTGLTCPAVDSAIITYSANVNTTTADGRDIVQALHDLMYGLNNRARKAGMVGVQWVAIMREELYRTFVENYVCKYDLYKCTGGQYEEINTNAENVGRMRREFLSGQYIMVDGKPLPVVFSEGIPQTTPAANTFESDMYIIPVSWAGMSLCRLEYFPMDNSYLQEFDNFAGTQRIALNNGMWLSGAEETAFCKEYQFANKMRLILETPWLAGRIDNLQYTFAAPIRNALPSGSFYYDGGTSYRT